MKIDMFSSLDPSFNNSPVLFQKSVMVFLFSGFIFFVFFTNMSTGTTFNQSLSIIQSQFVNSTPNELGKSFSGLNSTFPSMFIFLLVSKFLGLIPYKFGLTTSIIFKLSISLVMWLSMNISNLVFSPVSFFSHLTPEGAPLMLVPLLNCIEIVSNFIRFLTLSLRITMNMMTGHIFMTLLSGAMCGLFLSSQGLVGVFIILCESGYLIFEFAVCVLQSYVFSLLLYQYFLEHSLS